MFIDESKKVHDNWIERQDGYKDRITVSGADGEWKDIITWDTAEDARRVADTMMSDPDNTEYFKCMDETSVTLWQWEAIISSKNVL